MKRLCSREEGVEKGSALIEFTFVALLLCLLLLVFIDFARLLLVYNGVTDSARAGTRYAIVHGANRTGAGVDGPSGTGGHDWVDTVVKNFASSAMLNPDNLTITVTYTPQNNIGDLVQVTVDYPYDPFMGYFPLSFTLRGRSQGRIAY